MDPSLSCNTTLHIIIALEMRPPGPSIASIASIASRLPNKTSL